MNHRDDDNERNPWMSEILDQFLCPLPYTLPEGIRKSIRDLVEYQDIEWAARHPNCVRHLWQQENENGEWGPDCHACFSKVPATETIGKIETALALHRALSVLTGTVSPLGPREFDTELAKLLTNLDQLLVGNWHLFFFHRDQLQQSLLEVLRLRSLLVPLLNNDCSHAQVNGLETLNSAARSNITLIRLLSEILAQGGLRCFLVRSTAKDIFSPGLEILLLCLAECGIHINATDVETIMMTNDNGDTPCPK